MSKTHRIDFIDNNNNYCSVICKLDNFVTFYGIYYTENNIIEGDISNLINPLNTYQKKLIDVYKTYNNKSVVALNHDLSLNIEHLFSYIKEDNNPLYDYVEFSELEYMSKLKSDLLVKKKDMYYYIALSKYIYIHPDCLNHIKLNIDNTNKLFSKNIVTYFNKPYFVCESIDALEHVMLKIETNILNQSAALLIKHSDLLEYNDTSYQLIEFLKSKNDYTANNIIKYLLRDLSDFIHECISASSIESFLDGDFITQLPVLGKSFFIGNWRNYNVKHI